MPDFPARVPPQGDEPPSRPEPALGTRLGSRITGDSRSGGQGSDGCLGLSEEARVSLPTCWRGEAKECLRARWRICSSADLPRIAAAWSPETRRILNDDFLLRRHQLRDERLDHRLSRENGKGLEQEPEPSGSNHRTLSQYRRREKGRPAHRSKNTGTCGAGYPPLTLARVQTGRSHPRLAPQVSHTARVFRAPGSFSHG